jgi:hypothetical protein
MAAKKTDRITSARKRRLTDAIEALTALQFGPRQWNETAAYTLLAQLDLGPDKPWNEAESPLRGITPIIDFVAENYGVRYAPNTRETIRDEAVKFLVEAGLICGPGTKRSDAPWIHTAWNCPGCAVCSRASSAGISGFVSARRFVLARRATTMSRIRDRFCW